MMTLILYLLAVIGCFGLSALLMYFAIQEWRDGNGDLWPLVLFFMALYSASVGASFFRESINYSKEQDKIKQEQLQQDAERALTLMHTA